MESGYECYGWIEAGKASDTEKDQVSEEYQQRRRRTEEKPRVPLRVKLRVYWTSGVHLALVLIKYLILWEHHSERIQFAQGLLEWERLNL